jgi:hypothetical protein
MRLMIFLVVLLSQPLQANELSTLRAALRELQGNAPLRGTAEYSLSLRTRDAGDVREEQGRIQLQWNSGPGGVSLTIPQALLDVAEREQRARRANPDVTSPTRNAISGFSALQVSEAVDFATTLLRELEGAELRSAQPGLLTFRLPPRLPRTERKHVRNSEVELRVWRSGDGVPVRVERTIRVRASFFFIRVESGRTDRWELKRLADRLVAVRHEAEDTTSGLTRAITSRATTLLTIQ